MKKSEVAPKKRIKKTAKTSHARMMTDADGTFVKKGDTVAFLDTNGIEMVDMETLEDCTGVINKISHKMATVDGVEYKSDEIRRIATMK